MSDVTEAQTVADIARQAQPKVELEPGKVYAVLDGEGGYTVLDTDQYAEHPRRAKAHRTVSTIESLAEYLKRYGTVATEVWADAKSSRIVGVLDAGAGAAGEPGWGSHRVTLELTHSVGWLSWLAVDGKLYDQVEFAQFVEDRLIDVVQPAGARLLEIVTTLDAKKKLDFKSHNRLDNGEVKFEYTEEITGSAGKSGELEIPTEFVLGLKPYVGGVPYRVTARLRYRVTPNGLLLGFRLNNPELILEDAFNAMVTALREGRPATDDTPAVEPVTLPIYLGTPG